MPTLDELYRQYSQAQTAQATRPSVGMLEAIPRVGKGLVVDFPIAVAKGIGTQLSNMGQAVLGSPVGIPSDPLPPSDDYTQRAKNFFDIFGLPGAVKKRYDESESAMPSQYKEDRALNLIGAIGRTVGMDVLGGENIKRLASGELTPEQIGETLGMLALQTAPVVKGISKLVSKAPSLLGENIGMSTFGTQNARLMRQARVTEGQLYRVGRAANEAIDAVDTAEATSAAISDFRGPARERPSLRARLVDEATMTDEQATAYISEHGQLPHNLLEDLVTAANGTKVRDQVFMRLAAEGKPRGITDATYEIFKEIDKQHRSYLTTGDGPNPLSISDPLGRLVNRVSKEYGVAPELVIPQTAEAMLRTVSTGAQNLATMSRIAENTFGRLLFEAQGADEAAVSAMKTLQGLAKITRNKDLSAWGKVTDWANRDIEGFRRAMLVVQPATTVRNIISQGWTSLLQIPESIVADLAQTITGEVVQGRGAPIGSYFGETLSSIEALAGHVLQTTSKVVPGMKSLVPTKVTQLESLLNAVPLVKNELMSASMFDINNSVLFDVMKARKIVGMERALKEVGPQSVGDYFRAGQDFLLTTNRLQESFFRRMMFQGRLDSHIRRLGYKDFGEVTEILRRSDPIPESLQTAIADATEHALKQTYAYVPEHGLAASVLKVYKSIPFATAIGPTPFPRFLLNQWRWQIERSPTGWFNMFEPKYRDLLLKGSENGFATADAYRALGKATTGSMLMSAAWAIRNTPEIAGAKYYQLKNDPAIGISPDDPRNDIIRDMRPLQPFVSYLFLADIVRSIKDDTPLNLNANELLDALTGIRRISEIPMFAIPDILRSIDTSDPETWQRAIKTPVGQYFASFFVPMKALQDIGAGVGDAVQTAIPNIPDGLKARIDTLKQQGDVERQELFGPARQNLAAVYATAGSDTGLPARYSPFTGKRMDVQYPLLRQALGVTASEQTPFQQLLQRVPDVSPSDLTGDYNDPIANNAVSRNLGGILSTELSANQRVGDLIATTIASVPREYQRTTLLTIVRPLREAAHAAAMGQDPTAFFEAYAKQTPPEVRQVVRKILRGIRSNANGKRD